MRDTGLTGDPLTGGVVLELHMFHPDDRREDEDREERLTADLPTGRQVCGRSHSLRGPGSCHSSARAWTW